jgi:hypothetical protein
VERGSTGDARRHHSTKRRAAHVSWGIHCFCRYEKYMGQAARYPCGHCGTLNNASDQFCANCGYLLAGGSTGTVPAFSNAPTIASSGAPASAAGRRVTGALAVGELLGARYRNVGLVGQGGFGAVYRASTAFLPLAIRASSIASIKATRRSPASHRAISK